MTVTDPSTLVAAGVVCWRMTGGRVRVLLVHRANRGDISLPKGKLEPRESLPEAAVRETLEETGLAVTLGAPLGETAYSLPTGRDKIVHYWAAEATDAVIAASNFVPSFEVTSTEWVTLKAARAKLSYERDQELMDRFAARADSNTLRTFAVVALRHGKAVPASSWNGPDSTRPLEHAGIEEAKAAARAIAAYRPTKLISSTAARCISTIDPLATMLGLDVKATAAISQDAHEDGVANVHRIVSKRVARRQTAVLCSHGPVLPDIIDEVATCAGSARDGTLRQAASLATGDFAVVHLSIADPTAGIVAVEVHSPASF
ncbi:NUDIX hydrolase [Marisediminicola antarctica]|uniref:NUDIX hydrolase n=1 Tax=Marisediminicola antarctica TaxID=674079 RepID=UPI001F438C52|nr:NUDIX domain-containing protein [Marisediminicola antarctica]